MRLRIRHITISSALTTHQMWQLTSAMKLRVFVEELGSVAALVAIPSGVSSLAFAFDISERTAVSLSWIWAVSRIFDFALIKADIIFLLTVSSGHQGTISLPVIRVCD
jgi:hypothetical protein